MNEIGLDIAECVTDDCDDCLQGGREGCRRMKWRVGSKREERRGTGAPVCMLEHYGSGE